MRTITYSICEYTEAKDGHDGFTVVETETLHVVTGDEQTSIDVPISFETRANAQAWIDAELAALGAAS
jgi:hypothetical protein